MPRRHFPAQVCRPGRARTLAAPRTTADTFWPPGHLPRTLSARTFAPGPVQTWTPPGLRTVGPGQRRTAGPHDNCLAPSLNCVPPKDAHVSLLACPDGGRRVLLENSQWRVAEKRCAPHTYSVSLVCVSLLACPDGESTRCVHPNAHAHITLSLAGWYQHFTLCSCAYICTGTVSICAAAVMHMQ